MKKVEFFVERRGATCAPTKYTDYGTALEARNNLANANSGDLVILTRVTTEVIEAVIGVHAAVPNAKPILMVVSDDDRKKLFTPVDEIATPA